MSNTEIELKLLQDYLDAALAAKELGEAHRSLTLYEKQIALCKSQGIDFNFKWCEAMVYYIQANHKLDTEGFAEKVLRDTARQSSGFDGLLPALVAKGRETSRIREAIAFLDQAIRIYEDDVDFWLMRAHLYFVIKEKKNALNNVNYLLSKHSDNKDIYLAARKLKDEIDALSDNDKKDGCFIATAVYGTPDSIELTVLRNYRDQVLLRSSIGKTFVAFYYTVSPTIAFWLSKSNSAKMAVRVTLLDPLVALLIHRKKNG